MSEKVGTVIIGAGVIGAAVAHAFRDQKDDLYILEASAFTGSGISSRNSGVIHAGIYYPPGSYKERLCRQGATQLYAFSREQGVPVEQTGKYIVANGSDQLAHLDWLEAKNRGAVPLHRVQDLPRGVQADAALFSPNTGVADQHAFIEALIQVSQAELLLHQDVKNLEPKDDHVAIRVGDDTILAQRVINCAGLQSAQLAGCSYALAKGNYFQVRLPKDLDLPHLVYPAVGKNSPALGIHLTRNLAGEAYLGPDLEWVDEETYAVTESRAEAFLQAAQAYLPWLESKDISPGYCGIRPKLDAHAFSDFEFRKDGPHLVHCLGIESPGLTAAMAIGDEVRALFGLSPIREGATHV